MDWEREGERQRENERKREVRLWKVSIGVKGWSILSMGGEREREGGGGENEREREMRLWRVSIGIKGWSILSMDGEREGGRERERCVYGWSVSS